MYDYLVVGSGLYGAVFVQEATDQDKYVTLNECLNREDTHKHVK